MRWALALLVLCGCDRLLGLDPLAPPDAPTPPGPSSFVQMAGGVWHSCGIHMDGTLWCWGHNQYGQVDPDLGATEIDTPHQVGAATWLVVSAWAFHTCGIQSDHTMHCWGDNRGGQLGDSGPSNRMVDVPGTWTAVATGGDSNLSAHTCAIDAAGSAWCWGSGGNGQLGNGSVASGPQAPQRVIGGPFKAISAGFYFSCALDLAGAALCWGNNNAGQIGPTNPGASIATPLQIGTDSYVKIASGTGHSCALRADGRLRCWGSDSSGELGDDNRNNNGIPQPVDHDLETDWIDVAASLDHTCALRAGGAMYCWGNNTYDEVVNDTSPLAISTVPLAIAIPSGVPSTFAAIGLGWYHTCAIDSGSHALWCAGHGGLGQTATIGSHPTPVRILPTFALSVVSVGANTACAIGGGTLWCWGDNSYGTVGDGTTIDRELPVQVSNGTWSTVAVGDHGCAIDTGNGLWCWGRSNVGQVGDGNMADHAVLAPIHLTDGFNLVTASEHSCANSGSLYCWGYNAQFQCGLSPNTPVYQPATVTSGSWNAISAGGDFTCGIDGSGRVKCWGNAGNDSLGNGTTIGGPNPQTAILPSLAWDRVSTGLQHACAGAGPTVYCWGTNTFGQLGNQTTSPTATPAQLPGMWGPIAAGTDHTCAIDSAGKLFCTGGNEFGQLGDNTYTEHHEMRQVGSDTDWAQVAAGAQNTCALKRDGSLWCWGRNELGEIGDGTAWRSDLQRVP